MSVKLIWSTPDGDNLISYMARVSNPSNQGNVTTAPRLIRYLIDNRHWSPFEMVNACFEIKTSRAIGRQILRHRSFSFQEFSQRYAEVDVTDLMTLPRVKGSTNRQGSIDTKDHYLTGWWIDTQDEISDLSSRRYREALDKNIAPELARNLLPEGLTPTTMYMNGTLRSWLHYISIRTDKHTQREHRDIALEIAECLRKEYPNTFAAFDETHFKHEMGSKTP
mgnify:CR=1 FL=1